MKLIQKWKKRTRKEKIFLYLCLILIILPIGYLLLGCPALSAKMAMHRAEKAALIGPSTVIGEEMIDYSSWNRVILGETENGFVLYGYNDERNYIPCLVYRERAGALTVTSIAGSSRLSNGSLPIILFDEYPMAVRAEIEFRENINYNGENHEFHYSLSSQRENTGYFRFNLPTNDDQYYTNEDGNLVFTYNDDKASAENYLIYSIGQTFAGKSGGMDEPIAVTVRLYDGSDELIANETISVFSWDEP